MFHLIGIPGNLTSVAGDSSSIPSEVQDIACLKRVDFCNHVPPNPFRRRLIRGCARESASVVERVPAKAFDPSYLDTGRLHIFLLIRLRSEPAALC
jgi:hypothetical protein